MSARSELDAAGITDPALRDGYRKARVLNARHGRTYYLATALLPPERRPHVHALYGFARFADDIVDAFDGTDAERADRFEAWSRDVLTDLEWGASSDPIVRATIATVQHFDIPVTYFADFLDSMRADLTVTSYVTYEDLRGYMWGSAAVIGLQMLPVLGRASDDVRWDVLEGHAIELGLAFQLTNFIRDVAEDLRRGRVYLPETSLAQFGVDRDRLARGVVDEPIRNLLAFEIERAREHYRAAAPGIDLVSPWSRDCLRTAFDLYGGILAEIEQRDYDVFSERVSVPLRDRLEVAGPALVRAVRARPTPTTSARSWRTRTAGLRRARTRAAGR
ncbi:phytoene/squalene synthase family protein [Jatrophihabitans sp. YIM 134969]